LDYCDRANVTHGKETSSDGSPRILCFFAAARIIAGASLCVKLFFLQSGRFPGLYLSVWATGRRAKPAQVESTFNLLESAQPTFIRNWPWMMRELFDCLYKFRYFQNWGNAIESGVVTNGSNSVAFSVFKKVGELAAVKRPAFPFVSFHCSDDSGGVLLKQGGRRLVVVRGGDFFHRMSDAKAADPCFASHSASN
jgi:hypothetical protein